MYGWWRRPVNAVGGARSIGNHAIKLLETCMDSCIPSTGAEKDNFECRSKAPARTSHGNAQLSGHSWSFIFPIFWTLAEKLELFKLTCSQIQLSVSHHGHLWWNPERKEEKKYYIPVNTEVRQWWGVGRESVILHVNNIDSWLVSHARPTHWLKGSISGLLETKTSHRWQFSGCESCAG